mmetsp:Transcript_9253/g.56333  ORF Transcript_9253/g.56333 Transcript_9253/m.56333 type:complete len:365 (+) Transcript_9253:213-1307(+)
MANDETVEAMTSKYVSPLTEAERKQDKCVVTVTGGAGYLGSALVARLLACGHEVRATVRNADRARFLYDLPGASERLKLYEADIFVPGAFDEAVEGCSVVHHVAAVYSMSERADAIIEASMEGVRNVLESVNKHESVRRVVLTSSVAAVVGDPLEKGEGHVFTEDDWSVAPTPKVLPYFYAKREAEREAVAICEKQSRWDLVRLNPPAIFGPWPGTRKDATSVKMGIDLATGKLRLAPNICMGTVDVRDVAKAHSLAMFPKAKAGRYLCAAEVHSLVEMAQMVEGECTKSKKVARAIPKPLLYLVGPFVGMPWSTTRTMVGKPLQFNSAKAEQELGMDGWIPTRQSLVDMVKDMEEKEIISPKR